MTSLAEFKYFEEARLARERKYGLSKLQLATDADEQPAPRTLKDAVEEKELKDLSRFSHTSFASTKHNGRRLGLQISWTL